MGARLVGLAASEELKELLFGLRLALGGLGGDMIVALLLGMGGGMRMLFLVWVRFKLFNFSHSRDISGD